MTFLGNTNYDRIYTKFFMKRIYLLSYIPNTCTENINFHDSLRTSGKVCQYKLTLIHLRTSYIVSIYFAHVYFITGSSQHLIWFLQLWALNYSNSSTFTIELKTNNSKEVSLKSSLSYFLTRAVSLPISVRASLFYMQHATRYNILE